MKEIWDIYDGNGTKTGRTMERGVPEDGDYMLCVHVYLCDKSGHFLMQKRAESKQSHPGEWDVTGGAVLSGENSLEGAIRETKEEIGITLEPEEMQYVGRIKKRRSFVDIYYVQKDFALNDCVLQKDEVAEIKFADGDEMLRVEREERSRQREYIELLQTVVAKNQNETNHEKERRA